MNTMKKITWISAAILLFLTSWGLAGCGAAPTSESAPLVIGIMPDVESIPLVFAEEKGYFAANGGNIQLEIFKSARDRDSALQGGQLDGVISDMAAVAFAHEGGIPLRITAQTDGNILLLGAKERGITAITDLTDQEIALSTNTVMEYSLDAMLKSAGMNPSDIRKTAIPQLPTRLEMLQQQQLAAAILPQPLAEVGLQDGAVWLCDTQTLGEKAGVIAFLPEALETKPEQLRAFFAAYNQAVADLNQAAPGTYDDFLIAALDFPESLKGNLPLPQYKTAQLPDEEIFVHVMQWLKEKELIQQDWQWADVSVDLLTTEP